LSTFVRSLQFSFLYRRRST